jgi:hypothetical protein
MNEPLRNQMRNQQDALDLLGAVELCKSTKDKEVKKTYSKSRVNIQNNKCTIGFDYSGKPYKASVTANENKDNFQVIINQGKYTVMKFELVKDNEGYVSQYYYEVDKKFKTYKTLLTETSILMGVFNESLKDFKTMYNKEEVLSSQEIKESGLWFDYNDGFLSYSEPAVN